MAWPCCAFREHDVPQGIRLLPDFSRSNAFLSDRRGRFTTPFTGTADRTVTVRSSTGVRLVGTAIDRGMLKGWT